MRKFWQVRWLNSSEAVVLGYKLYAKNVPPLISWLGKKVFIPSYDLSWWVKHRLMPTHQYHIIRTGLKPGYYDTDEVMLHGCFALLVMFIEKEKGGLENFVEEVGLNNYEQEAIDLYTWWKEERISDAARYEVLLLELFGNDRMEFKSIEGSEFCDVVFKEFTEAEELKKIELRKLEEKIQDDEQAMLHRLINIRRNLWT